MNNEIKKEKTIKEIYNNLSLPLNINKMTKKLLEESISRNDLNKQENLEVLINE